MSGGAVSLVYCDLDEFKELNDRYGHSTGDIALVEFARRLTHASREDDRSARVGGDELVVMLEHSTGLDVMPIVERIRAIGDTAFDLGGGTTVELTVSVGVATSTGDVSGLALLDIADRAMYESKRQR